MIYTGNETAEVCSMVFKQTKLCTADSSCSLFNYLISAMLLDNGQAPSS